MYDHGHASAVQPIHLAHILYIGVRKTIFGIIFRFSAWLAQQKSIQRYVSLKN